MNRNLAEHFRRQRLFIIFINLVAWAVILLCNFTMWWITVKTIEPNWKLPWERLL